MYNRWPSSRWGLLALLSTLTTLTAIPPALAVGTRDAAALAAMKAFAGSETGVVVWQSRRSGPMRIFGCDLDGANLRQISPDVSGKDHLAPLLSPDGSKVLYYQTATLGDSSYYNDHVGEMMIVNASATKGSATQLVNETRTYFECRFARWIDSNTIAYIGKDHHGYTYSISGKSSTKLFSYPRATFGAIPNKQKTYAIDGFNRIFSLSSGSATQKDEFDGCEGNMTNDGLYAYRVKGGSHDFTRIKLGTWTVETFFSNHDAALPSAQNYIYFPQLSACQRYLALGVSPNQHDHFNSDYDIFVVPIDPKTYKKTGKAVKYSFNSKLDAYPDIYVGPSKPALSSIVVTAPTTIVPPKGTLKLKATLKDQTGQPFSAAVSWSVSGGGSLSPSSSGTAVTESSSTFTSDGTAGSHVVSASAGGVKGTLTITVFDPTSPLKINCGANDKDVSGWTRDDAFVTGGQDWTNSSTVDTTGVSDAAPAGVYSSVRHTSPHSYSFSLPNGDYQLKLHFADAYNNGRKMNYEVEGKQVLTDLDPAAKAGGVNKAWVETINVTVSDGDGMQIKASAGGGGDVFECGLEVELVKIGPQPDASTTTPDGGVVPTKDAGPATPDAPGTDPGPGVKPGLTGGCAVEGGNTSAPLPLPLLGLALLALLLVYRRRT
jgi:MYXO-CTERM domain-containing protein